MKNNPHYQLIQNYYDGKKARRSEVPYIHHIDEGLIVLRALKASRQACEAYCLHPIVQSDADLTQACRPRGVLVGAKVSPVSLALAMEYRRVANAYLSIRKIQSISEIELSPLADVQVMLIADKVQNRKDFEIYHQATHPRSRVLDQYFRNWLRRLNVTEKKYHQLCELLKQH